MNQYQRKKGFTLIELLVVIGIIGILAALLATSLSTARASARSLTCKNHLHQMGLALQMYVDEHQGKYPLYYSATVDADNTAFWSAKLLPYYPLKWMDPAYHCPGNKGAISVSIKVKGGWTFPNGSYAYNAKGVGKWEPTNGLALGLGGRLSYSSRPGRTSPVVAESQIAAPSEMFAVGESRWKSGEEEGGYDFMRAGFLAVNRGVFAFDPARHGKNYNQLFCDGHVSAMSPWVVFNPRKTAAMWNYDHLPHPEFWPSE